MASAILLFRFAADELDATTLRSAWGGGFAIYLDIIATFAAYLRLE